MLRLNSALFYCSFETVKTIGVKIGWLLSLVTGAHALVGASDKKEGYFESEGAPTRESDGGGWLRYASV